MSLTDYAPSFFTLEHRDDVSIARFAIPRVTDDDNIELMGHELFQLVEQYDRRKVVLNLDSVEYVTSSVLGKFITLHRRIHRRNGRLVLCGPTPVVRDALRVSRLIDYFHVTDDLPQALDALRHDGAAS